MMGWSRFLGIPAEILQKAAVVGVIILSFLQRSYGQPISCKDGMFYEENVFSYLPCSVCEKQSHYRNCDLCCSTSTTSRSGTVTIIRPSSRPVTNLSIAISTQTTSKVHRTQPTEEEIFEQKRVPPVVGGLIGLCAALVLLPPLVFGFIYCISWRERRSSKRRPLRTRTSTVATQETSSTKNASGSNSTIGLAS